MLQKSVVLFLHRHHRQKRWIAETQTMERIITPVLNIIADIIPDIIEDNIVNIMHDNISNNIMTLIIIRDIISTTIHFYFLGRCHAPAEINVQNLKTKRRCPNDLQCSTNYYL